jgi:translation initiation factor 2B subunit (eIF-2B alpha/beta/delta family)
MSSVLDVSFQAEAINLLRAQINENVSCTIALLCLRRSFESLDSSSLASEVEKQTSSLVNRLSRAASERGHFVIAGISRRVLMALRMACKKKSLLDSTTAASSVSTAQHDVLLSETKNEEIYNNKDKVSISDLALLFGVDDEENSNKREAEMTSSSLKWSKGLSQVVLDVIGEIEDEVENQLSSLSTLTSDLIKPVGETLLLLNPSSTVISWLLDAHRKRGRNFQVIICEGDSDGLQGHESATTISAPIPIKNKSTSTEKQPQKSAKASQAILDKLAATGIHTTLIPDSAAWACMPRVTLVVLSSVLVSKKSSSTDEAAILCSAGSSAIAVAAKAHSVPVIVYASSLSILPINSDTVHAIANSQSGDPKSSLQMSVVDANFLGLGSNQGDRRSLLPSIICPRWDALGDDHVNLIVTSTSVTTL